MKKLKITITALLILAIASSYSFTTEVEENNYYVHCSTPRVWSVYTNLTTGVTYHQYCIGGECITEVIEGTPSQIQNTINAICVSHND